MQLVNSCSSARMLTLVTAERTLRDGKFNKIAIADPATAPYGTAAVETIKALNVYDVLSSKIVQGSNIAQLSSSWRPAMPTRLRRSITSY